MGQQSHFVGDPLSHWEPVKWPEQRPGVGATPALADDSGQKNMVKEPHNHVPSVQEIKQEHNHKQNDSSFAVLIQQCA